MHEPNDTNTGAMPNDEDTSTPPKNAWEIAQLPLGEALKALEELKKSGDDDPSEPKRLPLSAVETLPNVFQARGGKMDEYHISDLAAARKRVDDLDPITVWRCGKYAFLVDGHHRLAAYTSYAGETGNLVDIPVQWLRGSLDEAMWAAADNSKAKLPMTPDQRLNRGWMLVLSGRYSKADEAKMAGISTSQIGIMRKVKVKLGEEAADYPAWKKALRASQRRGIIELSEEELDAKLEAQIEQWAFTMRKAFGTKLPDNTTLAAKVLDRYFGRKIGELVQTLADECGMTVSVDDPDGDPEPMPF